MDQATHVSMPLIKTRRAVYVVMAFFFLVTVNGLLFIAARSGDWLRWIGPIGYTIFPLVLTVKVLRYHEQLERRTDIGPIGEEIMGFLLFIAAAIPVLGYLPLILSI